MAPYDDDIPAELRGLTTRMDPVPAHLVALAKESLAWRDTDAALAELVGQLDLAAVRGEDLPDLFTFTAGDLTIEVEVAVSGLTAALTGQLVPPQPARIRVDHADGPTWVEADALGRFAAACITRGHLRLCCYPAGDGGPVQTSWTLI
ncbi:hypothetical protein ACFQY4_27355 [Catellatospora bangladeshensis]|uniref:Uncharacterized protein n=1 Tax=Catellatospora bangladeshensis TaxID=310355 RepID=A0A8J3NLM5_9ACTN|nr:hypothetical protein [Catellatospora bangladeshensis]GIF82700.1 hypothetical protein Cba03nite_40490 [Catellatospora bangladeshensis]